MQKVLNYIFIAFLFTGFGWFINDIYKEKVSEVPMIRRAVEKPFEKYQFSKLMEANIEPGEFSIKEVIAKEEKITQNLFEFEFNANLDGKTMKKVTGQINLPDNDSKHPLVIMFRGYIDQTLFRTGDGTRNVSRVFAENGYITVAPDFLGYGGSDEEAGNIFETRFQTYVTAVALLNSLNQIEAWDGKNVFIWGHSNGGQIALTTLEITGNNYPTTLWAPVSKPFPYSVLYYTDESEDGGKLIRSELAKFEKDHDPNLFSLTNYLDKITAPIQIQQGNDDEAVPKTWSDKLVRLLKDKEKDVQYFTYPGTDHNMQPNWDAVVERDLAFFRTHPK